MNNAAAAVPYLDLSEEFAALKEEWLALIEETGRTGRWILGPNVSALEEEIAGYVGVEHAVAVANGTDALILSLRALGIGPGDEVITSPFTFFASAEAISMVGATPVFADIDAASFNIHAESIAARITERTRAILPVHIFGYPCDMSGIRALADEHGLAVVEDLAQAFGAEHRGGRVGSFGDTGATSFYPTKVLGGYGDGGMIFTRRADLREALLKLRNHGATAPFLHDQLGYNSRLDEVQAALLRIKLRTIEAAISRRDSVADRYDERLRDLDLRLPQRPAEGRHVFNLYTIRIDGGRRDALRQHLGDHQIPTSQCYPLPMHLQAVYRDLGGKPGDLPVVEQICGETLSLPIYPDMRDEQIDRVCEVIAAFF
ncbi:MAG: DegT/DnrJ/EryC1/StrS family aminotransferase [Gammaproteobacteria bacterium]